MIIRSQDKGFIINFQKVDAVCLGGIEGKSVITFTNAQVVTLGTYSTEEKAIKVLDMITGAYCASKATECLMNNTIQYMYDTEPEIADDAIREYKDSQWFQMPQDSEV